MKTMLKACTLRTAVSLIYFSALCWSARAAAPANDNFANAELITILQGSVTGSNIDATREDGEPDHAGNQGGASVWWKITPPESGYLTLSTLKSTSILDEPVLPLDTELAVYTGSELSNLVLKSANEDDDENGSWTSKLLLPVIGGTQYYIAVDGWTDGSLPPDQGQIVLELFRHRCPDADHIVAGDFGDAFEKQNAIDQLLGVLHLAHGFLVVLLGQLEKAPVLAHLGLAEILIDGRELGGEHLVQKLHYRGPQLLHDAIVAAKVNQRGPMDIADLGCGTPSFCKATSVRAGVTGGVVNAWARVETALPFCALLPAGAEFAASVLLAAMVESSDATFLAGS
jgi:hypothetical protein